jgi:hypothetical protein
MVRRFVPDDALYYLVVARNVATGHGVTFDGTTPTNGFHPLWQLLTAGLGLLSSNETGLLHGVVLLGTVLGAGTVVLFDSSLRQLGVRLSVRMVASVWLILNPFTVDFWTNGVESTIWGFSFILLVRLTLAERLVRPAWLGLVAGTLLLARTDSVLLVMPALYRIWQERRSLLSLVEFVVAGTAVVIPWLAFSAFELGGVVQTSGLAIPWWTQEVFRQSHPQAGRIGFLAHSLYVTSRYALYVAMKLTAIRTVTVALVFALLLMTAFSQTASRKSKVLAAYFVATLATIGLGGFLRWVARDWYFYPLLLSAGLSIGWVLEWSILRWPQRRWATASLALLAFGDPFYWKYFAAERYIQQGALVDAAQWAASDLPPSARIAAFNSGIEGYFSKHRVINLDGVVNEPAFSAIRSHRLGSYIEAQGITQLIDVPSAIDCYAPFFGCPPRSMLRERRRFPGEQGEDVVVWDVIGIDCP